MIESIQNAVKEMADIQRGLEKRYQTTYNYLFGRTHPFFGEPYTIIGLILRTVDTKVEHPEQDGAFEIAFHYEPILIFCKGLVDGPDRIRELPLKHYMVVTTLEPPWKFDITIEKEDKDGTGQTTSLL